MIWNKKKKATQVSQSLRDKGYKIKYSSDGSTYQIVDDQGNPVVVTANTVGMEGSPAYGGVNTSGKNKHKRYRKLIGRDVTQNLETYKAPKSNDNSTPGDNNTDNTKKYDDTALKALEEKLKTLEEQNKTYSNQYNQLSKQYKDLQTKIKNRGTTTTTTTTETDNEDINDLLGLTPADLALYNKQSGKVVAGISPFGTSNAGEAYTGDIKFLNKFKDANSDNVLTRDYWFDPTPSDDDIRAAISSGKKYLSMRGNLYLVDDLVKAADSGKVPYIFAPVFDDNLYNSDKNYTKSGTLFSRNGVAWKRDNGKWKFYGYIKK